ncbi:ricin-type beta-trefoil lectin protein [Kutzneria buriramensis]|uniref:Ricin-type beta-trefoil lectin protein n=2 Tax=Kutzneria buriramensis TaxID=1045776 RepID=A0A3E0H7M5_9PSEU|nr:ricin-type beta-trefoil lectin protein [Kutzneria buriramensis]
MGKSWRDFTAVVVAVLAVLLSTTATSIPAAADRAVPGKAHVVDAWGAIVSRWSSKCMDMWGVNSLAQQWDCNSSPAQLFTKLQVSGDDDFLLQNQGNGDCLLTGLENGALIEHSSCNYGDSRQHWKTFDPGANSTGAKWLINLDSNRCVEVPGWATQKGVLLAQSDCVLGWKQYWFGL